jgi:hypothetical protein
MVDVEVIETEDTHGYLKHGRKLICGKKPSASAFGEYDVQTNLLEIVDGAPFCKDSLRRIFLTVIRRTSCMLRPA